MKTQNTRAEHLKWCKERAREYLDVGKVQEAWASFGSDMGKHDETRNHIALMLGHQLFFAGHLNSASAMRTFIEGFN